MWLIVISNSTGAVPWIVYRNRSAAVARLEQDGWHYVSLEHRWLYEEQDGWVSQTAVIVAVEDGDAV